MTTTLSRQEYRALVAEQAAPKNRKNKFGAEKTVVDGITFDSKREAKVYSDLKLLERSGKISGLELQKKFDLIVNGQTVGTYTADFVFIDHEQGNRQRVIDVKGVQTREFRRTRKILMASQNINVEVWT